MTTAQIEAAMLDAHIALETAADRADDLASYDAVPSRFQGLARKAEKDLRFATDELTPEIATAADADGAVFGVERAIEILGSARATVSNIADELQALAFVDPGLTSAGLVARNAEAQISQAGVRLYRARLTAQTYVAEQVLC